MAITKRGYGNKASTKVASKKETAPVTEERGKHGLFHPDAEHFSVIVYDSDGERIGTVPWKLAPKEQFYINEADEGNGEYLTYDKYKQFYASYGKKKPKAEKAPKLPDRDRYRDHAGKWKKKSKNPMIVGLRKMVEALENERADRDRQIYSLKMTESTHKTTIESQRETIRHKDQVLAENTKTITVLTCKITAHENTIDDLNGTINVLMNERTAIIADREFLRGRLSTLIELRDKAPIEETRTVTPSLSTPDVPFIQSLAIAKRRSA